MTKRGIKDTGATILGNTTSMLFAIIRNQSMVSPKIKQKGSSSTSLE
jgi:hypothetical protein